jgi:hypothetical protein
MLNYERDPAIAGASAALDIAERLGLMEVQANARITVGTARYQAGDRSGLDELYAAAEFCRDRDLIALRRATQNLAHAVREEGDWVRSEELLAEGMETVVGGQSLTTGYSDDAMRAYFDGDFGTLLTAADAFVDTPTGHWDMQIRGMRSCLCVLRGSELPGGPDGDDVADAVELARGSGFHRLHWTALAYGALCRGLQGRDTDAAELITELVGSWRAVPALASGEWIGAAAYASVFAGRDSAVAVRGMLDEVTHRTPWAEAALRTATGAVATADGDHARAAKLYAAAANIYAQIPDATDQMLALSLAATAYQRAGDKTSAKEILNKVRVFAHRNKAPGLLRLSAPSVAPARPGPVHAA